MTDIDRIAIPEIVLRWSSWYGWQDLVRDARQGGVTIPNGQPGVYEVKRPDSEERLTIGKASDLRMRIRQGLIKGKIPHSPGERMRAEGVDCARLLVRWAVTERPAAVEEELHRRYRDRFGKLPEYTKRT